MRFAAQTEPGIETEVIHLGDLDVQFCDGRDPGNYTGDTGWLIGQLVAADALIVGCPVYRGSYPGFLKNVFDLLPNDGLEGKSVGLIATGGTDHHFLAIEHELKPLLGFFHAHIIPGAVYAHNGHFEQGRLCAEDIREQLHILGRDTLRLSQLTKHSCTGPPNPWIPRKSL